MKAISVSHFRVAAVEVIPLKVWMSRKVFDYRYSKIPGSELLLSLNLVVDGGVALEFLHIQ